MSSASTSPTSSINGSLYMTSLYGQRAKRCKVCKGKNNTDIAVSRCIECNQYMCQTCTDTHTSDDVTQTHTIFNFEDSPEYVIDPYHESNYEMCDKHPKPMELYCETCEIMICYLCSNERSHRSHEIVTLNEHVEEQMAQVTKVEVPKIERLRDDLAKSMHHSQTQYDRIQESNTQLAAQLDEQGRHVKEEIDAYINDEKKAHDDRYKPQLTALQHDIESQAQQIEKTKAFLDDIHTISTKRVSDALCVIHEKLKIGKEVESESLPLKMEYDMAQYVKENVSATDRMKAIRGLTGEISRSTHSDSRGGLFDECAKFKNENKHLKVETCRLRDQLKQLTDETEQSDKKSNLQFDELIIRLERLRTDIQKLSETKTAPTTKFLGHRYKARMVREGNWKKAVDRVGSFPQFLRLEAELENAMDPFVSFGQKSNLRSTSDKTTERGEIQGNTEKLSYCIATINGLQDEVETLSRKSNPKLEQQVRHSDSTRGNVHSSISLTRYDSPAKEDVQHPDRRRRITDNM